MRRRPTGRRAALFIAGLLGLSAFAAYQGESAPTRPPARSAAPKPAAAAPPPVVFARDIAPVFARYCLNCHGDNAPMSGISLTKYRDEAAALKDRDIMERVAHALRTRHMPPPNLPAPAPAQRDLIAGWIEARFAAIDCDLRDPGRVTLRRLNRAEYNNTIRDLFGIQFRPADDFPSDDVGYGFDNIGDVLSLSPLLMEKYLSAAERITQLAIVTPDASGPTRRFEAEALPATGSGSDFQSFARNLFAAGEVYTDFAFPKDGDYLLRARAFGQQAGPEPARMAFRVAGKDAAVVDVPAKEDAPGVYKTLIRAAAGTRRVSLAFVNDYYNPQDPNPRNRDRNLIIDYLEIVGPLPPPRLIPESHRRIFFVQPTGPADRDECARKILASFARRAFRRPVTAAEVERLLRYVRLADREGESFERGIQLAIQAILVSPNFLFRVEMDPPPPAPKPAAAAAAPSGAKAAPPGSKTVPRSAPPPSRPAARPLNGFELASRLSYFLWSSMPDDELFRLAETGQLLKPDVLRAQVRRMLLDPKSRALVDNFAMQWLTLRNLRTVSPDPKRFPQWNEGLRLAMLKESELFFDGIMREDRSVLEFLDANYTYVNERLAKHYGIEGVTGDQFRRVTLADGSRGGLLTQAGILTVTSNPTRTSPVKRGKWVLEQMLGTPPPPPPPNVPLLADDQGGMLTGTLRQRMEQHRKDPMCATCHARMDALGFGLEYFDAVGAWRTMDGQDPVDGSGVLPDGAKFDGPAGLKKVLLGQKDQFVRNLTQQLLTYALGRGLESGDRCSVDSLARATAASQYRFSALVNGIVLSEPFRMRREEGIGP